MAKKSFFRNAKSDPANPSEGWPGPDAVTGTMPSRPVIDRVDYERMGKLQDSRLGLTPFHPLILCVGETGGMASNFAIGQASTDSNQSFLGYRVVFFGGRASYDLPSGIWQKHINPDQKCYDRYQYRDWFKNNIDGIVQVMNDAIDPNIEDVYIFSHLGDPESGILASLLYVLRTFPLIKQKMVNLVVSPQEFEGDRSANIPGLNDPNDPLTAIREVERCAWRGYYQQKQFPLHLQVLASSCSLVDSIFWIKSSIGGKEADGQQMAEFLAIVLYQPTRAILAQQMAGPSARITDLKGRLDQILLNEACCSTLYLPIAEHRNYLRTAMIKELLFGVKGVFCNSGKGNANILLNVFRNYSEYQHPLFGWLIEEGNSENNSARPTIPEVLRFTSLFTKHILSFIDQQFLLGSSIFEIQAFLELLTDILQKKRTFSERQKESSFSSLVREFENATKNLLKICKDWVGRITNGVSKQKEEFLPFGTHPTDQAVTIQNSTEENLRNSVESLGKLSERKFSIPAIDGNIARDQQLITRIQERIENYNLAHQVSWWMEDNNQKCALYLFIGTEEISLDDLDRDFWPAMNKFLNIPVSDLMIIDNEHFKNAVREKATALSIVNQSGLMDKKVDRKETLRFLFSNAENICRDSSPQIFGNGGDDIQTYGKLPYSRLTALVVNTGITLEALPIYRKSIENYLNQQKDNHLEPAERLGREIEKFLLAVCNSDRFISPEIIFCLQEEQRTKLFFEAFLCGIIRRGTNTKQPGEIWMIEPVGDFLDTEICKCNEKMTKLQSLFTAYQAFSISLLPANVAGQNISPFHIFNWDNYSNAIASKVNALWTGKRISATVTQLLGAYGIQCTESQLQSSLDKYFLLLFDILKKSDQYRDFDMERLVYYYYQQGRNERA